MKKIFSSQETIHVSPSYLLSRYRTMMVLIGILYPLWREVAHLSLPDQDDNWTDRGAISIFFLVFGLLTYRSEYFKRNVSTFFNIIIYIWFLQTFYLMLTHDFSADYLILGIVVIFISGSSFLNATEMLYYYLFCIFLTGIALAVRLDIENLSFFAGVIISTATSYLGLKSISEVFSDLEKTKEKIQEKNEEFIELSSAVQTLFLPAKNAFETERWSIAGFYRAVDGCGGDWWSYSENKNKLTVVLGDVTGHGPGSAMMTASIASYMHAIENESPNLSVPEILDALNAYLIRIQSTRQKDRNSSGFLMTICAVQIDLEKKVMNCWCAGSPFGFLLKANGDFETVGQIGSPLGVVPKLLLGASQNKIDPGDRLALFTDGIIEAEMKGRPMSDKRLIQVLRAQASKTTIEALGTFQTIYDSEVSGPQQDDYTLVLADFK